MRNAFDHLMRSIDGQDMTNESIDREFDGATRHLQRALFDAFEVLVVVHLNKIQSSLSEFTPKAISTAFPKYYNSYNLELSRIKRSFAEARKNKFNVIKGEYNTKSYERDTESLLEISDTILTYIPEINKVERRLKRNRVWDIVKGIIIGVIVTVIGGLILNFTIL